MNAREVIRIGRRRSLAPSSAASTRGLPCSYCSLANSTIRIAFFAARSISITNPILRVHIGLDLDRVSRIEGAEHDSTQPQHGKGTEYRDRRTQQHAER